MRRIAISIIIIINILCLTCLNIYALPLDMEYRFRGTVTMYVGRSDAYFGCEKLKIDPSNEEVVPLIVNDRMLLPLRFVAESFDAGVEWDQSTKSALLTTDSATACVTADEDGMLINGEKLILDQAAFIWEDRMYLPIRAIAEQVLGQKVFYYDGLVIIGDAAELFDEEADEDILGRMIHFITGEVKEPLELYPITNRYPGAQEGFGEIGYIDYNGNVVISIGEGKHLEYYEGLVCGLYQIGDGPTSDVFYDKENKVVLDLSKIVEGQKLSSHYFREGMAICSVWDEVQRTTYYGAINKKGELVVKPKFKWMEDYSDGLSRVSYDGKTYGFVDRNGKMVIEPKFTVIELSGSHWTDFSFSEGLAVIATGTEENPEYAYIDKNGNIAFEGRFKKAGCFHYGLAAVKVEIDGVDKAGYINKKGEFVVSPEYNYTYDFSDGLGCATKNGEKFFFNRKGEEVLSFSGMEEAEIRTDFHEGFTEISVKGEDGYTRYGFMNKKGEIAIEPKFVATFDFQGGLALVVTEDWHVGYIKTDGTFVWQRYLEEDERSYFVL